MWSPPAAFGSTGTSRPQCAIPPTPAHRPIGNANRSPTNNSSGFNGFVCFISIFRLTAV
ncbi:hypothetical protein BDN67DRAFT_963984 [Paxillus ammoniavirescens]|nr:hypothetical protein BDN67DRAFT_963984 [Paxillus ammoniavirescens]